MIRHLRFASSRLHKQARHPEESETTLTPKKLGGVLRFPCEETYPGVSLGDTVSFSGKGSLRGEAKQADGERDVYYHNLRRAREKRLIVER